MKEFDAFIQYCALARRFRCRSIAVSAKFPEDLDVPNSLREKLLQEGVSAPVYRNVCAKLEVNLVDRLDKTLGFLDISKRAFIEVAVVEALNRVEEILKESDVYDSFQSLVECEDQDGGKTWVEDLGFDEHAGGKP